MTIWQAFLLGIVQGITEFIPVSSTAHLFIAGNLLGVPLDARTFSFNVIIQMGTVGSLIVFFWQDIWKIVKAFFIGIKQGRPFLDFHARLGWLILIATIPAAISGLFFQGFVHAMANDPLLWAGIRLSTTAILLIFVEYFDKQSRALETANWLDALSVGFFQILAIFPGASRSGSTIAGGMIRGFDRPSAARFAFLMSAPILAIASTYETVQVILLPETTEFLPFLITGFISSGIVGWLVIKWLLSYLRKHSLYFFAAYCFIVAIIVLLIR